MYGIILLYQSIKRINIFTTWFVGIITGGLTLRCIRDFIDAYNEEVGFNSAFQKVKKRIFATIIAISAASFIAVIKKYYT